MSSCQTVPDPCGQARINDLIGRGADTWTLLILDAPAEQGTLRLTRTGEAVPGISQKMPTRTLHQVARDGLATRTIFPVVPPRVDFTRTDPGLSLGAAFCSVWLWAQANLARIDAARPAFDTRSPLRAAG